MTLPSLANNALPTSSHEHEDLAMWLSREKGGSSFHLVAPNAHAALKLFRAEVSSVEGNKMYLVASCDTHNAKALRVFLPNLTPQPLGLKTSAGFGDRLGFATPGHVRALQKVGGDIAPLFAQQSVREMSRSKRTPDDVMRDATWGTFEAGWQGAVGADADHLKNPEHIDATVEAGFSFFTFDPGEYVDDRAEVMTEAQLKESFAALPWKILDTSQATWLGEYAGKRFVVENTVLECDTQLLLKAAVKYGRAVAHVVTMYQHLKSKNVPFEVEISVDETNYETSPLEHLFIARELKRLGVQWVSLAPRFVGNFEKGIDYLGDISALKENLRVHAAIARTFGPYKLSLHSGSDKFSVYPLAAEATRGLVHLKTAGTSYLEALRVVALKNPELFNEIWKTALARFETDRQSYHLSCDVSRIPQNLQDSDLVMLLGQADARQVLHVTFGSVLEKFRTDLVQVLTAYDELYYDILAAHFEKHLESFVN